ncbi:peroxiredoxin family protein [Humidesulfovibrio idahonensis]
MNRLAAPLLALLLFAASIFTTAALAANPKAGDVLPDQEVKVLLTPAEAEYLGLPAGTRSFRLSQIKAEALLVEIYSMYCPRCQAEAQAVNRVFARLAASPEGKRLKFLAIGAGNSPFEVEFFRKKYQVQMPMLPDASYALHKVFGSVGTPSFFVLKPGAKGLGVAFFQEGAFLNEDDFYAQVLRAAALR